LLALFPAVTAADLAADRAEQVRADLAALQAAADVRGGWQAWSAALEPFREDLRGWDTKLEASGNVALRTESGLVFNGFDFTYHLAGSFVHPAGAAPGAARSPVYANVVDLSRQLAERGIDLIFVPVPPKSEVCPESLSTRVPEGCGVSPERAELMASLLEAGVEVIDLLPGFLEEKGKADGDCLYLAVDSHWNHRGIASAARQIAARLRRYEFVPKADSAKAHTTKQGTVRRVSSVVKYMKPTEKESYPAEDWTVEQVITPDGTPYKDIDVSPVLVLGDSFTTFFAEDSGGISAHLAKEPGMPVSGHSHCIPLALDPGAWHRVNALLYPGLRAERCSAPPASVHPENSLNAVVGVWDTCGRNLSGCGRKTMEMREQIVEAVAAIRGVCALEPRVGIVLGTGLNTLADKIEVSARISYGNIPHFPSDSLHGGELVLGHLAGKPVVAMSGRFHYYEGFSLGQVTFPVRVAKALGVSALVVSNAAGGMNPQFQSGDLMIITDHINLMGDNPLIGPNDDALGPRFPDMSEPYARDLVDLAEKVALELGIKTRRGVYVAVPGPCLETRAEYRFLRTIGADAVGMSTVPEVIVAVHAGLKVLGFSAITDECFPEALKAVDIERIIAVANGVEPKLSAIVLECIRRMSL
jgi:purine-nucleoside phosphorylase